MNKVALAVIVVLATAILLGIGNAQIKGPQPSGQIGRYQLLQGEHIVVGQKVTNDEKVVLRIDTATGQVSEWQEGTSTEGKYANFWFPIGERPQNVPVPVRVPQQ